MDRNAYHLSVPKVFPLNIACGFLLGAFSFLGLRALAYSPLGALIGSFLLLMSLLFVAVVLIEVNSGTSIILRDY